MIKSIPRTWTICKFEDIIDIISGKNQKEVEDHNGQYPIYGSGGKMGMAKSFLCNEGTIIIGRKGTINSPIYVDHKFWNVDTAFGLYPIHISSKLFYYYCLSFNFKDLDKSTTIPSLSKSDLLQIKIPLPPLPEQHRIVAKIEELFSELDKGIETLKTAQQQLKVYRQAVLKFAFEGKLTNPEVRDGELPEGWCIKEIQDVAKIGTGATPLKSNFEYYKDGNIAWITSGALNDDLIYSATDFITEKALLNNNLTVYSKNTLLVALYGEGKTRGKCSELQIEACTNQAIAAISLHHDFKYLKKYLKYFLQKNYENFRLQAAGGVQPNLNLSIIKSTKFPFPYLSEEVDIVVQEVESRLSVCDNIESSIERSLQQAEALRQSILKKAFEGKLVPQDPNDEPASMLLERIRAERAAAGTKPTRRRKKAV